MTAIRRLQALFEAGRHRLGRHADLAIALALTVSTGIGLFLASPSSGATTSVGTPPRSVDVLAVLLSLGATMTIVVRRRWPVAVLVVTIVAVSAFQIRSYNGTGQELGPLVAAYSVGAYSANRRRVTRTAATLIGGLALVNIGRAVIGHHALGPLGDVVGNTIVFGTAFVMGDNVRRRRQRIADLEERGQHLAREREMVAHQTLADEQRRIAREMHDVVAHSLSVMVVQAGAARRVLATRPEQASEALTHVEATGREALTEMRRLLGVLRGEEPTVMAPQPSLGQLDQLAAADPSLAVCVTIVGVPRALPSIVDLQAYRIVQEALTNVRKHAGPARAAVDVTYAPEHVDVTVTDDGRGASVPLSDGDGHGLVGMRERVSLVGGTLHVGPRTGGGWMVSARLPLARASADETAAIAGPRTDVAGATTDPASGARSLHLATDFVAAPDA